MKRFLGVALACVMLLTACGGTSPVSQPATSGDAGQKSEAVEVESSTETQKEDPQTEQTVFHVGETARDGDLSIVYVASGEYKEGNQYLQPGEGNKYIFLTFVFENVSDKSDTSVSSFSFDCYADGYACDAYFGGDGDVSATLSPGRQSMGSVYFEVPAGAEEIEVEYEINWISEKKLTFVFEGDKDSGFTLEKNTQTSSDALHVGDKITSSSLNITYLDCFADSSDNMFIKPKDGCHYVTCEFEFENVSNSDQSVRFYSFDCYADGVARDLSYFRDDAISATISAGRKAKGTVTFEIPDDAEVVEVEYLSNFWTSNRVVFDASGN